MELPVLDELSAFFSANRCCFRVTFPRKKIVACEIDTKNLQFFVAFKIFQELEGMNGIR
jgi:hypothetical protein